jgi:hypothetical protein
MMLTTVHDADDVSRPDRLRTQFEVMQKRNALVILGSYLEMITEMGEHIRVHHEPVGAAFIRFHLQVGMPFGHPTVMMRADYLKRMSEVYLCNNVGDYHLFTRMILAGARADNLPEPLVRYRIHPKQQSAAVTTEQEKIVDEVTRSSITELTGRAPSESHCTAAFRQIAHAMLTGNPAAFEVTSQIVDDLFELIGLCRKHESLTWLEAHSLKRKLGTFARLSR